MGDEAGSVADGVGACCAGCCAGVVGALGRRLVGVFWEDGWGKRTLRRYFIEICPAARLMRSLGTKSGDTFLGPWRRLTLVDDGPRAAETNTFVKGDGSVVLHF